MFYIGGHARDRFCERTPFKTVSEQNKVLESTLKNGLNMSHFCGEFYDYICSKQFDCGVNKVLVNVELRLVFVFDNNAHKLCTVYNIPEQFLPIEKYIKKEQENVRCFVAIFEKDGTSEFLGQSSSGLVSDIGEATEFKSHESAQNCIKNNKNVSRRIKFGAEVEIIDL